MLDSRPDYSARITPSRPPIVDPSTAFTPDQISYLGASVSRMNLYLDDTSDFGVESFRGAARQVITDLAKFGVQVV